MWIKICGLHDITTAQEVVKLSPDAIGLNFFASTPRAVSVDVAAQIVAQLPKKTEPVGLFVNHSLDEIDATTRQCRLPTVQLHGGEPVQLLADLNSRAILKIIRAWRLGAEGLDSLADYFDSCCKLGVNVAACLIDARVDGMYGGSGKTVCWELLNEQYRHDQWPPMILAGGLHPGNVAEAIERVRPWGVDVASGVESAPGTKDLKLVEQFIREARRAFEAVDG